MEKYYKIFFIALFGIMLFQMLGFGIYLRKNKISMGGVTPINPIVFKMSAFNLWHTQTSAKT